MEVFKNSSGVRVIGAWPSPFAMRVRIALNIKCAEYEYIEVNLLSKTKSDLLLQSNPVYQKVPVLFHGDRNPISESLIIVQYVDEVWASGPSILPSDPYDRAVAQFLAGYIDKRLIPALKRIAVYGRAEKAKRAAAQEEATKVVVWLEAAFTKISKGQKFFGGDRIGYLDIALGSSLAWVKVAQKMSNFSLIDEERTPDLYKWAQHFSADDVVKDLMPETDKLLEFAKALAVKRNAYKSKL